MLHVVLCDMEVLWFKTGKAVQKRRGECCLRADNGMGSGKLEERSASR